MKKILSIIAVTLAVTTSCTATPPIEPLRADLGELMDAVSYRYVTMANEEADADAVMRHCDSIFLTKGFTRGLTGDGYGGPCSIIEGYYRGGHVDTTEYRFVPDVPAHACVIEIAACNDGEDRDYGYPVMSVQYFDRVHVDDLLRQINEKGFKLTSEDVDDAGFVDTFSLTDAATGLQWTISLSSYDSNWFNISVAR